MANIKITYDTLKKNRKYRKEFYDTIRRLSKETKEYWVATFKKLDELEDN